MVKKQAKKPTVNEKLDSLIDVVGSLAGAIKAQGKSGTVFVDTEAPASAGEPGVATVPALVIPATKEEIKEAKEVEEATPDEQPMNPHWKRAVHEILGEDFDCEATYPKSGGILFKVIVPKDKSNASQAYWEMNKRDVRTREIGHTGLEGVKKWCALIKKNLARTKGEEI